VADGEPSRAALLRVGEPVLRLLGHAHVVRFAGTARETVDVHLDDPGGLMGTPAAVAVRMRVGTLEPHPGEPRSAGGTGGHR
jgi:hypothetical protein